jgi:selenocysteine-specific translation elongation factor
MNPPTVADDYIYGDKMPPSRLSADEDDDDVVIVMPKRRKTKTGAPVLKKKAVKRKRRMLKKKKKWTSKKKVKLEEKLGHSEKGSVDAEEFARSQEVGFFNLV